MLDSELVDQFERRLLAAVVELRADRDDTSSPLRDQLVARLGTLGLARLLRSATTARAAVALLAPLARTGLEISSADLHIDAPLADSDPGRDNGAGRSSDSRWCDGVT